VISKIQAKDLILGYLEDEMTASGQTEIISLL